MVFLTLKQLIKCMSLIRSLYSKNKLDLRPDRAYPAIAPDINVAGIYNSVENLTTAKAPENPPTNNPITPQQLI